MTLVFPKESLERFPKHLTPGLSLDGQAFAVEAADRGAAHAVGADRPGLRPRRRAGKRQRPHQAAQRRAARRAHHRARPCARRGQASGARRAGRDLAGQCLRPLRPYSSTSIRRRSIRTSPAQAAPSPTRTATIKFITVKPGAYPWGNHHNAWRPNHIHFSVFGHSFLSRLVTQMYFPGDYLFPFDPIFNSVTDEKARAAHGVEFRSGQHHSRLGAVLSLGYCGARARSHAAGYGQALGEMSEIRPHKPSARSSPTAWPRKPLRMASRTGQGYLRLERDGRFQSGHA